MKKIKLQSKKGHIIRPWLGSKDEGAPLPSGIDAPTAIDGFTHVKFGYGSGSMVDRAVSPVKLEGRGLSPKGSQAPGAGLRGG